MTATAATGASAAEGALVTTGLQADLAASARRFLEQEADVATDKPDASADPGLWARVAGEQGWHALLIAEEHGGLGGRLSDLCAVLEESGRVLLGLPLADTAVCGWLLQSVHEGATAGELLPELVAGDRTGVAVPEERIGAVPAGDGLELSGSLEGVVWGDRCELLLLWVSGAAGPALVALERAALTDRARPLAVADRTRPVGALQLDGLRVPADRVLARGERAEELAREARALRAISLAAENVGIAQRCLEMALSYAQQREQFGRPIGSFQAVKHRIADMLRRVENGRSAVRGAAAAERATQERAAATARIFCSDAAVDVAERAIQVHGGIGFTMEHPAHLFLRRALVDRVVLWPTSSCREFLRQQLFETA